MTTSNPHTNGTDTTTTASAPATYYDHSVELFDLGRERFDQDTAGITDRDYSLLGTQPVVARAGRAPRGLESQVHAWNTFQFTTDEGDGREELKGDMHGGLLHRENRAAREPLGFGGMSHGGGGGGGFGNRGGRGGGGGGGRSGGGRLGEGQGQQEDALCAGRKPDYDAPPLAKGMAEEMDKSMFWDGPIL
ncbi:hypothetical protein DDE82_005172 [Stemphylium lycopersici]|nr:hypothetical protein TW65_03313 [Stemphylium lycopersici]RAR03331.1 hypothetical protein DDE82_005172 [Stemphylium lycopersici]